MGLPEDRAIRQFEEHIKRPFAHTGVDKTPQEWQAEDLASIRQQFVSAIIATRPEAASAIFEGEAASDGVGNVYVRLNMRDINFLDVVDDKSGGEMGYKTVKIPFDGKIQVPTGIVPRKRVVSYTLDAYVVQVLEKIDGDDAGTIAANWKPLQLAEINNWKKPNAAVTSHVGGSAIHGSGGHGGGHHLQEETL